MRLRSRGLGGPATSKAACGYGFTLIEMLVAVTLVMLMMVMFAEIFQLAGASVTKQRALSDNDQNARTFVTVIRADLDKLTIRTLVPFFAGELSTNPGTPFNTRKGYFSISCNNNGHNGTPQDGSDDVLQLTADVRVNLRNADESPYYGRAVTLPGSFFANPNQPEADDGQIIANDAGASRAAEISLWMRGGKLYRRVMPLRDPIPAAGVDPTSPGQPILRTEDANGNGALDAGEDLNGNAILDQNLDYFVPANGLYPTSRKFWYEFDYSAHRNPFTAPGYAVFNGLEYLANDAPPLTGAPGLWTPSLGQPWNRFGHNHEIAGGGLPREFSASTTPNVFIGRFTQEETSHVDFNYPQTLSVPGNFNPMDTANALAVNSDGVVAAFANGGRTGVDLLLSHVHEFRVELWDQRLNDFAPVGHNLPVGGSAATWGDFNINRRLNATYGPLGGAFNVFDTWHPNFNRNNNIDAGGNPILGDVPDRPPYRPLNWDPSGVSGPPPTNPSGAGASWAVNTNYQVGDIVFPRREDLNGNGFLDPGEDGSNGFPADGRLQENVRIGTEDVNYNNVLDSGEDVNGNLVLDRGALPGMLTEDLNANGVLDAGEDGAYGFPTNGLLDSPISIRKPFYPFGLTFAYRCVRAGTSGIDPTKPPGPPVRLEPNEGAWSTTLGHIIHGWTEDANHNNMLDPGEDVINPGVIDREPDWIVEYNVRPLRAIRITVRFEHPSSKQMRQVTIVHSLRDTTSVP